MRAFWSGELKYIKKTRLTVRLFISLNPIWHINDLSFCLINRLFGPRREKTCLRGFRQSEFQTSLLRYRDYLENWNFTCAKFTYDTFQIANNKALIRLRGCAGWSAPVLFANPRRQVFSRRGPFIITLNIWKMSQLTFAMLTILMHLIL